MDAACNRPTPATRLACAPVERESVRTFGTEQQAAAPAERFLPSREGRGGITVSKRLSFAKPSEKKAETIVPAELPPDESETSSWGSSISSVKKSNSSMRNRQGAKTEPDFIELPFGSVTPTFNSNGTIGISIGNSTINSDGSIGVKLGNTTFNSDGTLGFSF